MTGGENRRWRTPHPQDTARAIMSLGVGNPGFTGEDVRSQEPGPPVPVIRQGPSPALEYYPNDWKAGDETLTRNPRMVRRVSPKKLYR